MTSGTRTSLPAFPGNSLGIGRPALLLPFGDALGWRGPAGPEEDIISAPTPGTWAFAENYIVEDDVLARARTRAAELGCPPVSPGSGNTLRVLAAAAAARSVVEIGTGAGVSGLYLLRGMPEDGVLTTIDVEVENQRAAREAFTEDGVRPNRARLISGRALDVLPRLTDGAYDFVLVDADKLEYAAYLEAAVRLLRPGGLVATDNALWHNKVADPTQRDEHTTAVRDALKAVRDDPRLVPALLPVGDGLLVAVKV